MVSQSPSPFHPVKPAADPPNTVSNTIFDCNIADGASFIGDTKADRMAAELFDNDFYSYMDKIYK